MEMRIKDLVNDVKAELREEKEEIARDVLKQRLRELEIAEHVMAKLRRQYEELLDKTVEEIVYDQ